MGRHIQFIKEGVGRVTGRRKISVITEWSAFFTGARCFKSSVIKALYKLCGFSGIGSLVITAGTGYRALGITTGQALFELLDPCAFGGV